MVPPAICQGKRQSAVLEWLSKLGYRKTTIATRMPNIRTTIANRLMWFPSQDSCGGAEFARKSGTNSSGVGRGVGRSALLPLALLLAILLLTIEAVRSPPGNGESAGSAFLHEEHGLGDCSGCWRRNYGRLGRKDCGLGELRVERNVKGNVNGNRGRLRRAACRGEFGRKSGQKS